MHICFVTAEYPPETGWGGIGTYFYELGQALLSAGHAVTVVSQAVEAEWKGVVDGVMVHRIFPARLPRWLNIENRYKYRWNGFGWAAWRTFHRNIKDVDIVEIAEYGAGGWMLARDVPLYKRPPIVVKLHTPLIVIDKYSEVSPGTSRLLRYRQEHEVVRRADKITAPSFAMIEEYKKAYGDDALPDAVVVRNPLRMGELVSIPEKCDDIVFVGRLEHRKGVSHLPGLISGILERNPGYTFTIIGTDTNHPSDRGSWMGRIRDQVAASLVQRVKHATMSRSDVLKHMARSRVSIFLSIWENYPYVVLESMAAGTPVVAFAVGGVSEIIENGRNGILVEPGNDGEMILKVQELIDHPAQYDKIRSEGRRFVLDELNGQRLAMEAVKVYEEAIRKRGMSRS